jgi:hypothetical protein
MTYSPPHIRAGHPDNWPRKIARKHEDLSVAIDRLMRQTDELNIRFAVTEFIAERINMNGGQQAAYYKKKNKQLVSALRELVDAVESRIDGDDHPWIPGANFHDGVIKSSVARAKELLAQ